MMALSKHIKVPELNDKMIKDNRGALMGISIIMIIIFHFHPNTYWLRLIDQYGWVGVDMFIYLSAIGLCYSIKSKPGIIDFYKRRLSRVIPTWWLFLTGMLILSIAFNKPHPSKLVEFVCYYTGAGWWLNGLLEKPLFVYYYEWYVPTLLALYALFPLLYNLPRKAFILMTIVYFVITELMLRHHVCESLSMSYPRLLDFCMGISTFYIISGNKLKYSRMLAFCMFISAMLLYKMGVISLLVFLPLAMPFMFYVVAVLLEIVKRKRTFTFLGTISLELYLVHIYWHVPTLKVGGVVIAVMGFYCQS